MPRGRGCRIQVFIPCPEAPKLQLRGKSLRRYRSGLSLEHPKLKAAVPYLKAEDCNGPDDP